MTAMDIKISDIDGDNGADLVLAPEIWSSTDPNRIILWDQIQMVVQQNKRSDVPESFKLESVYPNPFNSKVIIKYLVNIKTDVNLQIFTINGSVVTSFQTKGVSLGSHFQEWNARGCSSGIYLIKVNTEYGCQTRKVVFLK